MSKKLDDKLKTALDATRLRFLGGQCLASILASLAGVGGWLVMNAFWYVTPLVLKSQHQAPCRGTIAVGDNQAESPAS